MRRRHGGRRARVRGVIRVAGDFALLGAAVNLARLAALGASSAKAGGWAVAVTCGPKSTAGPHPPRAVGRTGAGHHRPIGILAATGPSPSGYPASDDPFGTRHLVCCLINSLTEGEWAGTVWPCGILLGRWRSPRRTNGSWSGG